MGLKVIFSSRIFSLSPSRFQFHYHKTNLLTHNNVNSHMPLVNCQRVWWWCWIWMNKRNENKHFLRSIQRRSSTAWGSMRMLKKTQKRQRVVTYWIESCCCFITHSAKWNFPFLLWWCCKFLFMFWLLFLLKLQFISQTLQNVKLTII